MRVRFTHQPLNPPHLLYLFLCLNKSPSERYRVGRPVKGSGFICFMFIIKFRGGFNLSHYILTCFYLGHPSVKIDAFLRKDYEENSK